jgi:hypothetical protein
MLHGLLVMMDFAVVRQRVRLPLFTRVCNMFIAPVGELLILKLGTRGRSVQVEFFNVCVNSYHAHVTNISMRLCLMQ